jgi:pyridoxal 5'-phosphate synthase pdxT subunit
MSHLVGVLAVQGAFIEHIQVLNTLGVQTKEIRSQKDLETPIDALILPGGESTTMRRLINDNDLFDPLSKIIHEGVPVLATCAGLILLAHEVIGETPFFNTLDLKVRRNAYGRQLGSFIHPGKIFGHDINMVFIRAPKIEQLGPDIEVLASVVDTPVAIRKNNIIATAFHPELSTTNVIHTFLLSMISKTHDQ